MRLRLLLVLLAAVSLLAGACGDDDTASDGPAATAEGDSSPDTDSDAEGGWTEARLSKDQQTLDAAILTLDDMPTGWEQLPDDDDEDVDQEEIAECVGADADDLYDDEDPEADASFGSPDDSQLDVGWTIAATVDRAEFGFETLTSDKALTCLRDVLVDAIEDNDEGIEVGDVTLNRMSFPRFGDDSTAMRVTVPMTTQGMSVDVFFDAVFVRVGRATGTVTYLSVFTPADAAEVEGYVQETIDKLDADAVS